MKNTFVSEDLGISMDVPVSKESKFSTQQIAVFYVPVSDVFAVTGINIPAESLRQNIEPFSKKAVFHQGVSKIQNGWLHSRIF